MNGRVLVAILLIVFAAVCCSKTSDKRGEAGTGDKDGGSGESSGGISGNVGGASGTSETGGTNGASGTQASSGSGGGGTGEVCTDGQIGCYPLCEGGDCECYCESTGGAGGSGASGSATAGTGGSGEESGTGGGGAGSGGTGTVDCNCTRGGYAPVCGVDGKEYDAICGVECVPVAIECTGPCPCATNECDQDCSTSGLVCCNGSCVNTDNDRLHCGDCDTRCSGATPYCNMGVCTEPPCESTTTCNTNEECCGSTCCRDGQICCLIMAGPWFSQCVDPVEGTCPAGCPMCVCADPDTPIATPNGERRIADIEVGDLVYSIDASRVVLVPVQEVRRNPVSGHEIVRITLETGRILELSARHPTAENGTIGELSAGQTLDGVVVTATETIPYEHEFTYDILPDSPSGVYFAAGVAIGSTLR